MNSGFTLFTREYLRPCADWPWLRWKIIPVRDVFISVTPQVVNEIKMLEKVGYLRDLRAHTLSGRGSLNEMKFTLTERLKVIPERPESGGNFTRR